MAFVEREGPWIAKQLERQRRAERDRRSSPLWSDPDLARESRARARRELPERLHALAREHGLSVRKVSVRNQKWRWGSCSRDGHICLNWRLVLMPDAARDYVLVHELMHLKRQDHSASFWTLVARACPDYQAQRAFLRTQRLD